MENNREYLYILTSHVIQSQTIHTKGLYCELQTTISVEISIWSRTDSLTVPLALGRLNEKRKKSHSMTFIHDRTLNLHTKIIKNNEVQSDLIRGERYSNN